MAAERAGDDPFERRDGWRLGGDVAPTYWRLSVDGGEPLPVRLEGSEVVRIDAATLRIDGRHYKYVRRAREMWIAHDGWTWHVKEATAEDVHDAHVDGELRAPMPGSVLLVPKAIGDSVEAGETIVVLESMKMELSLVAPVTGTVTELVVAVGDKVGRDEVVARVEVV